MTRSAILALLIAALPWLLPAAEGATASPEVRYPADAGVIDVKLRYGAKGDGVADDTAALQRALTENAGVFRIIYFPAGTYLLSDTLTLGADFAKAKQTVLQGQGRERTVLRLKDGCPGFGDAAKPKCALSFFDGESSGQAFANSLCDLSVDTGSGNPGAIAVRYMAHNQGALREVALRSGDGHGVCGLDLTRRWPGPAFISHVEVSGFDVGVDVGHYDYSLTFEHIALRGQRVAGLRVSDNKLSIRVLASVNRVPAVQITGGGGFVCLFDSTLDGGDDQSCAVVNHGRLVLRRVSSHGYRALVDNHGAGIPDLAGPTAPDYLSHPAHSLFGSAPRPLDLPIREPPALPDDDPARWVAVDGHDGAAIQAAIDRAAAAGRATVYLRGGVYDIAAPITVHGSVRRLAGLEAELRAVGALLHSNDAAVVFTDIAADAVQVDRLLMTPWDRDLPFTWFENRSAKTLILRDLLVNGGNVYRTAAGGSGPLFIEDVCGVGFAFGPGQQVWARQINPEDHTPLITCDHATAWLFGLKTEGMETVIAARGGSRVELIGGYIFPIHAGAPQLPAFTIEDSAAWLAYGEGIIAGPTSAYQVHVRETRGGQVRELRRADTDRLGDGALLTVFATDPAAPPLPAGGASAKPAQVPSDAK